MIGWRNLSDRGRLFDGVSEWIAVCRKTFTSRKSIRHGPRLLWARERLSTARRNQRESGFLLLAVLLMMALMIIAASIEIPQMVQQMKRDREEEMIHRGTEYARAVKKYYKKFGRYPANLEQLDNTNQIRFLRKRYKDPLTKGRQVEGAHLRRHSDPAQSQRSGNSGGRSGSARAKCIRPTQRGYVCGHNRRSSPHRRPPERRATLCTLPRTGFDANSPIASQQQTGLAGTRCFAEARRKGMLSRVTIRSRTPSAWERVAVSREARLAASSRAERALVTRSSVAIRLSVAEPSSASPA